MRREVRQHLETTIYLLRLTNQQETMLWAAFDLAYQAGRTDEAVENLNEAKGSNGRGEAAMGPEYRDFDARR